MGLKKICLFVCLLSCLHTGLKAEISLITVKWLPNVCLTPCVQSIVNQFLRMNGAAEFAMLQQQGQANIRWKPKAPFSVEYLNSAMRMAGPSIHDIRVKVRGTIVSNGSAVFLQSLGDNTQFLLLGPLTANVNQYVQASFDLHKLSPESYATFLDAERASAVAIIEGPLFEPIRTMGLYLIVEQTTFERLGPNAIQVP